MATGAAPLFIIHRPAIESLMDGRESAVYTSEIVDTGPSRRWRKSQPLSVYGWHLIPADRPLTACGLEISYTEPRRRWVEIPEDQRCQGCRRRFESLSHIDGARRRTLN